MFFCWSLSDSKFLQVSGTLHSIITDLNNTVVKKVSTRPIISNSFNPCTNTLVSLTRAPITIGIIVTFMFHSFFSIPSQGQGTFLSFQILLIVLSVPPESKVYNPAIFLLIITRSSCLGEIWWSVCISKSQSNLCVSFPRTDSWFCIYHFFVWSDFLHDSQWITLPTQLCLVLYSFCANLLPLLNTWLTVLSLSPYNLHLLIWSVLYILALILLVLIALFCVAIRGDSISLVRVPFFSCEMLLVSR